MDELSLIKDEILALEILLSQQHSTNLLRISSLKKRTDAMLESFKKSPDKLPSVLDLHIDSFHFSPRTRNCLCRAGLTTIRMIMGTSQQHLLSIEGLGQKSLDEILFFLNEYGIVIPED